MKRYFLFTITFIAVNIINAQTKIDLVTYKKVMQLEDSVSLFNGQLKLCNVFKKQIQVIYENQDKPETILKQALVEKTYLPYKNLWSSYVGDQDIYINEVMMPLIKDSLSLLNTKGLSFASNKIDNYFKKLSRQMEKISGRKPKGLWFIAFGSGVTDMGGFGGGKMVLDLTHYKTSTNYVELILPHELNHQIFDLSSKEDTTACGLYRCINEGFAVYMNQKILGNKHKLNEYLQYSESELHYCLTNEATIFSKIYPFLLTDNKDHAIALADRGQKIFKNGPGAIGYFIGYKICEAYIKKYGINSFKDIYTLPVREILEKSGYNSIRN